MQRITESYTKYRLDNDLPISTQHIQILLRWAEMTIVNNTLLGLILKGMIVPLIDEFGETSFDLTELGKKKLGVAGESTLLSNLTYPMNDVVQ